MKITLIAFFFLALLAGIQTHADQNDERLNKLFEQLQTSSDPESAHRLERMIWVIWLQHQDKTISTLMQQGINTMQQGNYAAAIEHFSKIIDLDPEFAEAWNKRATVYYLQRDYSASMLDVQRTLALEPRHFGALSGLGLIFTALGDYTAAIRAYQDVLRIHPQAVGARVQLNQLHKKLHGEVI